MKLLVPTDFSDTAKNAARYAVELAAGYPDAVIVLYNVYEDIAAGSDGSLLTETDEDREKILLAALAQQETELQAISPVKIMYQAEKGSALTDSIDRYVQNNGIDLVVMGITGANNLEQVFIGSNAINMAREGNCPVIIVPPDARFRKIERVVLTSDFKNVSATTPADKIRTLLNIFKPVLHIVQVSNAQQAELTEDFKVQKAELEKYFGAYQPQFHFITMPDFLEAISNFTADYRIDLIVTIPKKHSFLEGLFKSSHTKRLAYHSHVPVAAIHE